MTRRFQGIFQFLLFSVAAITSGSGRVQAGANSGYNGPPETVENRLSKTYGVELTEEALVTALRDPRDEVRVLAALKLANDHREDAIPAIGMALGRESVPGSRIILASALRQLGDPAGTSTLKGICSGSMGELGTIRLLAARQLVILSDNSCVDDLLGVLRQSSDFIEKRESLTTLVQVKKPSGALAQAILDASSALLEDKEPEVRIAASHVFGAFGERASANRLNSVMTVEPDGAVKSQMQSDLKLILSREHAN